MPRYVHLCKVTQFFFAFFPVFPEQSIVAKPDPSRLCPTFFRVSSREEKWRKLSESAVAIRRSMERRQNEVKASCNVREPTAKKGVVVLSDLEKPDTIEGARKKEGRHRTLASI